MFTRKTIIKKTMEVSGWTLFSRVLGIIREVLMVRFLGAGAISDAFLTAYKIPNSLRKIFAEGALSAAFVPTVVQYMHKKGREAVNGMMTLAFLFFEGIVLVLCFFGVYYARQIIELIAPGFSAEQIAYAVPYLQIVMPFIFFISSSALLAAPLQAVGHFFIWAFSPVLLNIVFIAGLAVSMFFGLSVEALCFFILFGGFLQLLAHLYFYTGNGFGFGRISRADMQAFAPMLARFGLGFMSMSVMEINLFIDTSFASLLPEGSLSLIYYANRFTNIPIGVLGVAFSSILLPHFSHICEQAPKRMGFWLVESAKLIAWVMIPATLIMSYFADDIFLTLFLSKKFTLVQAHEAGLLLIVFLSALFFFAFNKILLNVFYAHRIMWLPGVIAAGACVVNVLLNFAFIGPLQSTGLVLATVIATILQTILFVYFVHQQLDVRIYLLHFTRFLGRYALNLGAILLPAWIIYRAMHALIALLPGTAAHYLLHTVFFWLWAGPFILCVGALLIMTRKRFGIELFFID